MTGSVYRIPIRFGDIQTPSALLSVLYSRLVVCPADEPGKSNQESEGIERESEYIKFRSMSKEDQMEVLMEVFRGYAFYS